MRRVSLALGLLAIASAAMAQSNQPARAGVSVSAYFFSDKRVTDVFGDPALAYGVNLSALNRPRANKPTFAYNIVTSSKNGSKFFLLPVSIGYETQFAERTAKVLPYARAEVGGAYYDVAIHSNGWDESFKKFGFSGAVETGIVFNQSIAIKARYNLFQKLNGVNLSGAEIGLAYNFFSF